jgi:hypothetical protein
MAPEELPPASAMPEDPASALPPDELAPASVLPPDELLELPDELLELPDELLEPLELLPLVLPLLLVILPELEPLELLEDVPPLELEPELQAAAKRSAQGATNIRHVRKEVFICIKLDGSRAPDKHICGVPVGTASAVGALTPRRRNGRKPAKQQG